MRERSSHDDDDDDDEEEEEEEEDRIALLLFAALSTAVKRWREGERRESLHGAAVGEMNASDA